MTEHNLFYYSYVSFTNAQLPLLKVAALWLDNLLSDNGHRRSQLIERAAPTVEGGGLLLRQAMRFQFGCHKLSEQRAFHVPIRGL
jgi:hypothetical protein